MGIQIKIKGQPVIYTDKCKVMSTNLFNIWARFWPNKNIWRQTNRCLYI